MADQRDKILSEDTYQKLIAAIEEKYGSQACDLEPLHAMLYFLPEESIRECMKASWCNEFLEQLRQKHSGV